MGLFFDFDTITIRKDSEGRYCLNDLHKVAGGADKHRTNYFLNIDSTQELIAETLKAGIPAIKATAGRYGGTYVCEKLVYAYAMWVSPSYHLKVVKMLKEFNKNGMVMKPEVAKQAFNDPKVFMAKALMLQKTLYCSNQWLPK